MTEDSRAGEGPRRQATFDRARADDDDPAPYGELTAAPANDELSRELAKLGRRRRRLLRFM